MHTFTEITSNHKGLGIPCLTSSCLDKLKCASWYIWLSSASAQFTIMTESCVINCSIGPVQNVFYDNGIIIVIIPRQRPNCPPPPLGLLFPLVFCVCYLRLILIIGLQIRFDYLYFCWKYQHMSGHKQVPYLVYNIGTNVTRRLPEYLDLAYRYYLRPDHGWKGEDWIMTWPNTSTLLL